MQVILNGEQRSLDEGATVADMLRGLGIESGRVAVEINENIVPRKDYADAVVRDGDRIEVVTFVGGGAC
ncbi:MAG: sulfur carrier protein ThiS [Phycisphaerae bacterium]